MKKSIILLVFSILLVLSIVISIKAAIFSASIDSWMKRAQDAGNPAQVAEFLNEYKEALTQANLIEGRFYTIFDYPGTYMPIYIRAVNGLIERAKALTIQNPTEESYQMGLINLEKDLGDLAPTAWLVWGASGGWLWLNAIWVLIIIIIIIIPYQW